MIAYVQALAHAYLMINEHVAELYVHNAHAFCVITVRNLQAYANGCYR